MSAPGWFVREREVVILCALACTSILLAVGSSIWWIRADAHWRRADAVRAEWVVLRDSMAAILARKVVVADSGAIVRVFPPPRVVQDTLKRAGR